MPWLITILILSPIIACCLVYAWHRHQHGTIDDIVDRVLPERGERRPLNEHERNVQLGELRAAIKRKKLRQQQRASRRANRRSR